MFEDFERYAVYWVPRRPDPLARFGTSWMGWCAERGEHRPRGEFAGLTADVAAVTRTLCRHGLHGVIRAPFRLAPGRSRFAVEHVLDEVAGETVSFRLPRLELAVVDGCVALLPGRSTGALATIVTRLTEALTPLAAEPRANGFAGSAPPTGGDPALVSLRAAEAHRFHLPLTDPQPIERAHALKEALAPLLAPMLDTPRSLSEIALMGDPGSGRPLRVLQCYELLDWPLRPGANALPCYGREVLAPMPEARRKAGMIA